MADVRPPQPAPSEIEELIAKADRVVIHTPTPYILTDLIRALRDALRASQRPAGQGWQPITDAPKDGIPFIAANIFDAFRAFYDAEKEVWIAEDSGLWFGCMKYPPTHFMPLPPQEKPDAN